MAGLPLKSGADFYNLEAARMRLHNLGADPTEVGAGLIYFNTSTGLNTSQKARLYTGSAWKTIAFSEDLDVASKADFLALKERVDLLSGDVDTDAIISNMKEVSAFLEGFAEDASLMDLLNGKLNTSGGTINGDLYINGYLTTDKTRIRLGSFYIFVSSDIWKVSDSNWQHEYALLHEGNVGDYALKRNLANYYVNLDSPLDADAYAEFHNYFQRISADGSSVSTNDIGSARKGVIRLTGGGSESQLLFDHYNGMMYYRNYGTSSWSDWKTILHSGNVEKYAVLAGKWYDIGVEPARNSTGLLNGVGAYMNVGYDSDYWFRFYVDGSGLKFSSKRSNSELTGKTIAFTDSNVAGATYLVDANGKGIVKANGGGISILDQASTPTFRSVVEYKANNLHFGYDNMTSAVGYDTYLNGKNVYLRYSGGNTGLTLNSSGNVTIGGSDLAGTSAKLYVDGVIKSGSLISTTGKISLQPANKIYGDIAMSNSRLDIQALHDGVSYLPITINAAGGNVLIGTTTDNGAKLQVSGDIRIAKNGTSLVFEDMAYLKSYGNKKFLIHNQNGLFLGYETPEQDTEIYGKTIRLYAHTTINGDLHVTGNIIADGEVSAGGVGTEGGNAGGGGAFHSESIAVGATQTTIAHGLGTDDIVVSIYEKDGVSGRWSIILTDVEIVDANNIIVSFGSATSVEHKVVIMGAVA